MIRTWLGRHEARILFALLGFTCVVRGVSYLPVLGGQPSSLPPGLVLAKELVTIGWWGVIWCAVGLLGLTAAVAGRWFRLAAGLMLALLFVWTAFYFGGWLFFLLGASPEGGRNYLNAATYLAVTIGVRFAILHTTRPREH